MATPQKTLFLVRHAKSSWDNRSLDDAQRPLNERGERDAPRMARWLAAQSPVPGHIISSPAVRAHTTAQHMADALSPAHGAAAGALISIDQDLYFTGVHGMLRAVERADDQHEALMLVGHNPVMTDLFNQLTGEQLWNMPTCAVAMIGFSMASWGLVDSTAGVLLAYETPKSLRAAGK
jgi:phosphohistidine phosphatase